MSFCQTIPYLRLNYLQNLIVVKRLSSTKEKRWGEERGKREKESTREKKPEVELKRIRFDT